MATRLTRPCLRTRSRKKFSVSAFFCTPSPPNDTRVENTMAVFTGVTLQPASATSQRSSSAYSSRISGVVLARCCSTVVMVQECSRVRNTNSRPHLGQRQRGLDEGMVLGSPCPPWHFVPRFFVCMGLVVCDDTISVHVFRKPRFVPLPLLTQLRQRHTDAGVVARRVVVVPAAFVIAAVRAEAV